MKYAIILIWEVRKPGPWCRWTYSRSHGKWGRVVFKTCSDNKSYLFLLCVPLLWGHGRKGSGRASLAETLIDQQRIVYGIKLCLMLLRDPLIAGSAEGHRKTCPCSGGRAGKGHRKGRQAPVRGAKKEGGDPQISTLLLITWVVPALTPLTEEETISEADRQRDGCWITMHFENCEAPIFNFLLFQVKFNFLPLQVKIHKPRLLCSSISACCHLQKKPQNDWKAI